MRTKFIVVLSVCSFIGNVSEAAPPNDELLAGRLEDAFYYNGFLDAQDITVTVSGGEASLKGKVPTQIERELAGDIALSVEGVSKVYNRLDVDEKAPGRGRVGFVQKIRDLTTAAVLKSKLLANRNTADAEIKVSAVNDGVTLSGTVRTGSQKELAERIAYGTPHVAEVTNNLIILEPKGVGEKVANATERVSQDVSDAWISTKVRSLLTFSNEFPGSRVSVTTNEGRVVLSGTVRSNAQRAQIEEAVRDVVGVKSVDNQISVREPA